jgi:hypothetical protein
VAQEGGYAPAYAPYCSAAIAETLTGAGTGPLRLDDPSGGYDEALPSNVRVGLDAEQAIRAVIDTHARFWPAVI